MKKILFLSTLLAAMLLATSCQKEQELVTLGAVINQPTKTYINDRYPCWNEGDEVYVNSAVYPVSAISGSSAQIADVVGADAYRAVFPASLVTPGSNIANNATILVTLPATQKYQVVDGHQRVDAPMGAYTDGGTLQFYNLCSIVHVVVNNNTGSNLTLRSLKMETANAKLSGTGTATVNGTSDDGITLTSDASHSVSLRLSGASNVTLAAGAQSAFDIYIPAFATDDVTLTLTTTDGYYYELTKPGVALRHNTYTTVTLNVDQLTQILAAELVDGWTFNQAIPDNATAVVFEYNSSVSSGTLLSSSYSPVPIYGNLDGTTWRVSTNASMINANPDCGNMFSHNDLTSIEFGENFNTENVTNMSLMFYYCWSLTSLDLSSFNTENVTGMDAMFCGCHSLISLDVSSFNTEKVTDMYEMFSFCGSLTSLDLSNFNTMNVTSMAAMFLGCTSLISLDVSSFNTEKVTTMQFMFATGVPNLPKSEHSYSVENGLQTHSLFNLSLPQKWGPIVGSNLQTLDLSNFNTTNVTDMYYMFAGCSNLMNLNLSHFDMYSVTYKDDMCSGLATTSGACTITCPAAVQSELENGTGLPTSGVTFTWVRPTSK